MPLCRISNATEFDGTVKCYGMWLNLSHISCCVSYLGCNTSVMVICHKNSHLSSFEIFIYTMFHKNVTVCQ